MIGNGRHGDYIGDREVDLNVRCAECSEDDACEELRSIELNFAIPVTMTQEYQRRLMDLMQEMVSEPYNQPKDGVHWVGFVGNKLTFSDVDSAVLGKPRSEDPDRPKNGEEPTGDDSVFVAETSARSFGWTKERDDVQAERANPRAKLFPSNWPNDVIQFHVVTDTPVCVGAGIAFPSDERCSLREDLGDEEWGELVAALHRRDMIEVADGIVDDIYVLVGMAIELGLPLHALWNEVQRSNMAKAVLQPDGSYRVVRRADGKILKPEGWTPPDIAGVLRAHGWKG
jgi:hypothetical protein